MLASGVPRLPPRNDLIHSLDLLAPYLDTIESLVDWEKLKAAGCALWWIPCTARRADCLPN